MIHGCWGPSTKAKKRVTRQLYSQAEAQRCITFVMDVCRAVEESAELLKSQCLHGGEVRGGETTGSKAIEHARPDSGPP